MKKFLYALTLGLLVLSCGEKEKEQPLPETKDTFKIEEIEAVSPDEGTFTVNVTTDLAFTVQVAEEATWLTYLSTKAVETKVVEFAVTTNEEDEMRQGKVTFAGSDGKTLGTLIVFQKAGAGLQFEIEALETVPVGGGTYTLAVTANVPFEGKPEDEWITVTGTTANSVTLEIGANDTADPRTGTVNFYREGTEKLIGNLKVNQKEPNVKLNDKGYGTLAEALEAYYAMTDGEAAMYLAEGTHEGVIFVNENNVPLTLDGQKAATLDGSIEIVRKAVTVKNLTIASSTEGTLPQAGANPYPFGIYITDSGYGVKVQNVTIDMSALSKNATGIFINSGTPSTGRDFIDQVNIKGNGQRNMQVYGGRVDITNNTFDGPYSSYCIRIGNDGGDIRLIGNVFKGTATGAVHFNNLSGSTVTIGDGKTDSNSFSDGYGKHYFANSDVTDAGNTFAPTANYDAATGEVTFNEIIPDVDLTFERLWAVYGHTGDGITQQDNWDRNGVIHDGHIYMTIAGKSDYGVAVLDLLTGQHLKTITAGFSSSEGIFATCGIAKIEDDIYVCNLASNGQPLIIYRLGDADGDGIFTQATEVQRFTETNGERFGDKMTGAGSYSDGFLNFVSYNYNTDPSTGKEKTGDYWYRTCVCFEVKETVFETTWKPAYFGPEHTWTNGEMAGVYPIDGFGWNGTYKVLISGRNIFRGAQAFMWDKLDGWYGDSGANVNFDTSGLFETGYNYDPRHIILSGHSNEYLAYVHYQEGYDKNAGGYLRIVNMGPSGDWSIYRMAGITDLESNSLLYPLASSWDLNASGPIATNGTAYCDAWTDAEGNTYILAGVTEAGMSVFKVK